MASRKRRETGFFYDAVTLEGGLFSPDSLEKICQGDGPFQSEKDYLVPKGLRLDSEYARAFHIAKAQWAEFAPAMDRKGGEETLTARFVRDFLRDVLGYSEERPASVLIGGTPEIPLIIAPHNVGLDESSRLFADAGTNASVTQKTAFQALQERLNSEASGSSAAGSTASGSLWGLTANGRTLRLLRASSSLTRPAYLEFDLQRILEEEHYPDFRALWFILHHSRAGWNAPEPVWEAWRRQGLEEGARVREKLREGVGAALLSLGDGFLAHPDNGGLRERLSKGTFTARDFYRELLRLIYRMLFVITLEERDLLDIQAQGGGARSPREGFASSTDISLAAQRGEVPYSIYSKGYSFRRLRSRSLGASMESARYSDLWLGVKVVFRALAAGEPKLALPALGGIFTADQCPVLDGCSLSNRALLTAVRCLRWAETGGVTMPVDYRNMGPEELGSVYESLLEYEPRVELDAEIDGRFKLPGFGAEAKVSGNERKTTGSYYTPHGLVEKLVESALAPVIERTVRENPENPEAALLRVTVIDPACGSGHFLIAAARRIADGLAQIRAAGQAPSPETWRKALRDVVAHCVYGVDLNPLAVELARFVLWLEGYEPGRSLAFLDHRVKCGNSLVGLLNPEQMKDGIPDKAFDALSGDDKSVCSALKRENKEGLKWIKKLQDESKPLLPSIIENSNWEEFLTDDRKISGMPDDTLEQTEEKEEAYAKADSDKRESPLGQAADAYMAAFLDPKKKEKAEADVYVGAFLGEKSAGGGNNTPTSQTLCDLRGVTHEDPYYVDKIRSSQATCMAGKVFHWFLEFPAVMDRGGFDCVLGNPPWERIKLQEEEFFAVRDPRVANARNKAERGKYIAWLREGLLYAHLDDAPPEEREPRESEKRLYREFLAARRGAEAASAFCHVNDATSRYRLTGVGDVNTYALFAETMTKILAPGGRAGFIVPTGIATDDSTKQFFSDLVRNGRLVSLYDFENREKIFPIDSRMKFCLMTVGPAETADFAFFLTDPKQLAERERHFSLSPGDFASINPNTGTCPIFRSRADAELTRKIYARVPVLIRDASEVEPGGARGGQREPRSGRVSSAPLSFNQEFNPWGLTFLRMLDMSNDSGLFRSAEAVEAGADYLPLYEAKMVHQFDHRWASYVADGQDGLACKDVPEANKNDPDFTVRPRYWVRKIHVLSRLARVLELPEGADLEDPKLDADQRRKLMEELDKKCPRWLMGWRDITNATNERTVIASVLPRVGVGNKIPLMLPVNVHNPKLFAALLANLCSLVYDYVARQKIGGTTMNYFIFKQLAVLPPDAYSQSDLDFIVPRVLELTYTSRDMRPWAADICPEHKGAPFAFDPDRRAVLRAELDAIYAKLYGLDRDELRYILDPTDPRGSNYPSETFRVLKDNETARWGEYRTRCLVLEAWDRM